MNTKCENTKNNLTETYTDDDGFVWNDKGDIIGIPSSLEKEGEELFRNTLRRVQNGEWKVKRN